MTPNPPHISVCICTYKRPGPLKRLLTALGDQESNGLFTYSAVVVDNDDAESARPVACARAAGGTIPVMYSVEPIRGIALARNACVEHAPGDFVAFIDDDECPTNEWLLTLFMALDRYQADGVLGPVLPRFEDAPPRWITEGGFYKRPRHRTGLRLDWSQCRTGNVLLKRRVFVDNPQPFRPEFVVGEDQDFFKRMIERRHAFVWCDEAVVYEIVPPVRWKRGVLLRRDLRRGFFSHRLRRSVLPIAQSLIAIPVYAAVLPFALVLGQARFIRYACKFSYHSGRLLAVVGINPIRQPYITE